MTTLTDIMRGAWTECGMINISTATGGSATTIVDTNTRFTTDDAMVGGTAIIISTTDGLSPQGKYARISDFVASTKTFTIDTVTDAVGSGDVFGLCTPKIPALQMRQAVNDALRDHIGTISKVDVSLTSQSGYATYTLPTGVYIKRLIDVQIEGADDEPYESIISRIELLPTTSGGQMISHDLDSGYIIKVIYEGTHAQLSSYSDTIHESVPEALLKAATVDKALTWLVSKRGESALGTFLLQKLNDARQAIANAKMEHPVLRVPQAARWFPK
jgi:hypothetical protein